MYLVVYPGVLPSYRMYLTGLCSVAESKHIFLMECVAGALVALT